MVLVILSLLLHNIEYIKTSDFQLDFSVRFWLLSVMGTDNLVERQTKILFRYKINFQYFLTVSKHNNINLS